MLNIAIAGLGTVGSGVVRLLQKNAELIAARAGKPIKIVAVSAKLKTKRRDCDLTRIEWVDDPRQLASVPGVDAVVELIGGAEGTAREVAESVLKNGKHLVTANKALIATHGAELAAKAEKAKVNVLFEAAVAGGIPVIKTIREALASNQLSLVYGILNGTCNFILTRMEESGLRFAEALREAQELGYAEGDPSADIDGHDAANKLAILSALAFGVVPDLASVHVEGIRHITPDDLQFAKDLGCCVRLLGVARSGASGVEQRVGPSLVSLRSPLAAVKGPLNAVLLRGDFVGDLTLEGRGAGAEPTATAVMADIIDLARGNAMPVFSVPSSHLKKTVALSHPAATHATRYYMRLQVVDKPGAVADISAILRDEAISIESLLQRGKSEIQSVPVVITTHQSEPDAMMRAVEKIAHIPAIVEKPCIMQIES